MSEPAVGFWNAISATITASDVPSSSRHRKQRRVQRPGVRLDEAARGFDLDRVMVCAMTVSKRRQISPEPASSIRTKIEQARMPDGSMERGIAELGLMIGTASGRCGFRVVDASWGRHERYNCER
ncbi:MAG: hypothetical protein WDM85_11085 [Caulobacteraceae bacterium]